MGIICPPLVEIELTDLPKSGGAMVPPGTPRDDTPKYSKSHKSTCTGFKKTDPSISTPRMETRISSGAASASLVLGVRGGANIMLVVSDFRGRGVYALLLA